MDYYIGYCEQNEQTTYRVAKPVTQENLMSSVAAQTYLTPKEYIAAERKATLKSEYLSGEIVAMSGASLAHNLITMNTATGLYNQLSEQRCRVFASDMRVGISAGDSYTKLTGFVLFFHFANPLKTDMCLHLLSVFGEPPTPFHKHFFKC